MINPIQRILWMLMFATVTLWLWTSNNLVTAQRRPSEARIQTDILIVQRVFPEKYVAARIKSDKLGNCYILNPQDHSIAVYDHQLKLVRRIGQIGNGPGEFYYPQDFALGHDGRFYIADSENNRVQILSPNGAYMHQFRFPIPISVAVLSNGEILVVGALDDQLIRVYSPEGKFLRLIGTLVDVGIKNAKLNAYLNRGWLIVDKDDNIYYLFRALLDPTVRKYSPAGKLLMEIHPRGAEMTYILSGAKTKLRETVKKGELGFNATLNAVQVDPTTGNVWIAPSGPVLYVYSAQGRKLAEYRLRDSAGRFYGAIDFTFVGGSKGCFVNPAGGFLFDLPKEK